MLPKKHENNRILFIAEIRNCCAMIKSKRAICLENRLYSSVTSTNTRVHYFTLKVKRLAKV